MSDSYMLTRIPGHAQKLYSVSSVAKFTEAAVNTGYTQVMIDDGSCGVGTYLLIPADTSTYYCFIIEEVYLNCWSSAQTVRKVRFERIGKKWWKSAERYSDKIFAEMAKEV